MSDLGQNQRTRLFQNNRLLIKRNDANFASNETKENARKVSNDYLWIRVVIIVIFATIVYIVVWITSIKFRIRSDVRSGVRPEVS